MDTKLTRFFRIYNAILTLTSLVALAIITLDWINIIEFDGFSSRVVLTILLVIFASDYLLRLFMARGKAKMLATNTFRLSTLVPTNRVMSPEHVRKVAQSVRGVQQNFARHWHNFTYHFRTRAMRFLRGGGLIYYLGLSAGLILIASIIYAFAEHTSFWNGLWWAIVTATTVGYGDVTPHTLLGRLVAIILMFTGIGLIGTLTSSITAYFTATPNASSPADELLKFQQLQRDGVISKKELMTQKNKLLH